MMAGKSLLHTVDLRTIKAKDTAGLLRLYQAKFLMCVFFLLQD